jgi:hypothetical protein
MAVIRKYSTWILAGGLALLFLGERVLTHLPKARYVISGLALAMVLAALAGRALALREADEDGKRVERLLFAGMIGVIVALALYALRTDTGAHWLAKHVSSAHRRDRISTAVGALWPLLLAISALPLVLAQLTTTVGRAGRVEALRILESAGSGLTLAFAAGGLFLLTWISSERDHKIDASYFRTSMPGSATRAMVSTLDEPLKVVLFFPDVNETKDEVKGYFDELAHATGKVEVETHDRLRDQQIAKDYDVSHDGVIVLVRGKQNEKISVDPDIGKARATLRELDGQVQKAFMKVARGARTAYFTVGHGEFNDPSSVGFHKEGEPAAMAQASAIRELLGVLNYKVQDLGLKEGLATDVPDDAAMVLVLGPQKPLLDEELGALDRYLDKGGAVLFAFDASSPATLGPAIEARLGVKFDKTILADQKLHLARRHDASDNRLIVTDQFSAHASVTTLSRSKVGSGIVLIDSGSLTDAGTPANGAKRTYTVRTVPTTFADKNGNNVMDGDEKTAQYNLVAAVEAAAPAPAPGADPKATPPRGMRALVVADATMISDAVLTNVGLNAALVADGVKWLGGEEKYAGDTTSEKDVPIEHTRGQDEAWFYSTIVGAPLLVLTGGLLSVMRRRKRPSKNDDGGKS